MSPERLRAGFDHIVNLWRSQIRIRFGSVSGTKTGRLDRAKCLGVFDAQITTMLDHYAQTDMDELIAAQEMMLNAIFSHAEGPVKPGLSG
jgi:hypothetical protein